MVDNTIIDPMKFEKFGKFHQFGNKSKYKEF